MAVEGSFGSCIALKPAVSKFVIYTHVWISRDARSMPIVMHDTAKGDRRSHVGFAILERLVDRDDFAPS